MRRYTLNISDREFVVDVQEIDADNFKSSSATTPAGSA